LRELFFFELLPPRPDVFFDDDFFFALFAMLPS